MESGQDFNQLYNQAYDAYRLAKYEEADTIVSQLEQNYPQNPHICLLKANIRYMFDDYAVALHKYERVLTLAEGDPQAAELIHCAREGIDRTQGYVSHARMNDISNSGGYANSYGDDGFDMPIAGDDEKPEADSDFSGWSPGKNGSSRTVEELDGMDWDSAIFNKEELGKPTLSQIEPPTREGETAFHVGANPLFDSGATSANIFTEEKPDTWPSDPDETIDSLALTATFSELSELDEHTFMVSPNAAFPSSEKEDRVEMHVLEDKNNPWQTDIFQDEPTMQVSSSPMSFNAAPSTMLDSLDPMATAELLNMSEIGNSEIFTRSADGDRSDVEFTSSNLSHLGAEGQTVSWNSSISNEIAVVPPKVDVEQGMFAKFQNAPLDLKKWYLATGAGITSALAVLMVGGLSTLTSSFTPTATSTPAKVATPQTGSKTPAPKVENKASTSHLSANLASKGSPLLLLALASGLSGFGVTLLLSHLALSQTGRSIRDLMNQFEAIRNGDFSVRATVYATDEVGALATNFNALSLKIFGQMQSALQRAEEIEKARDDLQRQVIRLLDDVEGAARGDLTVEAEVTADVLGTVADAFNLTIKNLREIVSQVKKAAKQVNKGSTDSELFARNNSSDALRMAEELAVTLNSVQMMTESVQRVAENAREAEEVAHTSSVTALKGGEAVERTVAGVLQIRETVSETARKVKRLAEASQEISKIVALISQIASRTNLLALNASIQAARAGEAGRGFAIVADEVRQLADRSAKSLKEIEHIVLQIQSETGSVMTAMEEGIQQVIDVTDKSEQAKRSLEDIIEVSNRINTLVRSITSDTVKQRENSRAVAQVMQSVELIAQETSQESQRVAGSLQNLVSISRDLLSSVEKFRVDATEN
jgi:twitching motility protein PilJ